MEITGKVYEIKRDTINIDTTVTKYIIGGRAFYDTTYNYTIKADTTGCRDTVFNRYLSPESGQMHILGAGGNKVKVTMNVTGGNPAVFDGEASDQSVSLSPIKRQIGIMPDNDESDAKSISYLLSVEGSGRKFENMILFSLDYRGRYYSDDLSGDISCSNVNCIATKNE